MSSGYPRATATPLCAPHEGGAPLGITPYGLEALAPMRIEKGHVAGIEINGQTTARDLGLGRMLSTRKDYVGRVMAARPALTVRAGRGSSGSKPVEGAPAF